MHTIVTSPIFSLLIIIIIIIPHTQASVQSCSSFSCNRHRRDTIQFPFRVTGNQSNRCGYPGFELSCDGDVTLLKLPSNFSDPFIVRAIDYANQVLWLSDPKGCVPNRVLNLNLTGSPYGSGSVRTQYSFLNCSNPVNEPDLLPVDTSVISCLSGGNFTVVSTFARGSEEKMEREWKCKVIKRVVAPMWWSDFGYGYYPADMSDVFLQLSWDVPSCGDCALQGGSCGFVDDSGLAVGCFLSSNNGGLPRSAEIGVILGVGIPGIICLVALTFYISGRVRGRSNQNGLRHANNTQSSPAIFPQPIILTLGLDRPTIESYPKTVLGESKRLPRPSDGTCPICLSEYQPKETLRSIPECNHYFHAECIDEWLRLNATCPLCRKSPQRSSTVAAC